MCGAGRLAGTQGWLRGLVGTGGQPQALAHSRWASTCLRGPSPQHSKQTQGALSFCVCRGPGAGRPDTNTQKTQKNTEKGENVGVATTTACLSGA